MPPVSLFLDFEAASFLLERFGEAMTSMGELTESALALGLKNLAIPSHYGFPFNNNPVSEGITREADATEAFSSPTMSAIHDYLVQMHIEALPSQVSGRYQVEKDRIARRVATELYLANTAIFSIAPVKEDEGSQRVASAPRSTSELESIVETTDDNTRLPSHFSSPMSQVSQNKVLSERSLSPGTQHKLPGSTLTSDHHSQTSQDHSESSQETSESFHEDPCVTRLRGYSTVSPQPLLPDTLLSLLSHWDLQSDPQSYSWSATRQKLAAARDESQAPDELLDEVGSQAPETPRRRKKLHKHRRHRGMGLMGTLGSQSDMSPSSVPAYGAMGPPVGFNPSQESRIAIQSSQRPFEDFSGSQNRIISVTKPQTPMRDRTFVNIGGATIDSTSGEPSYTQSSQVSQSQRSQKRKKRAMGF
jgi:RNA polymerase I-specific transcription-initiation factor